MESPGQHLYFGAGTGPLKASPLQTFVQKQSAVAFPDQSLDPLCTSSAEKVQRIRDIRASTQAVLDDRSQTVHWTEIRISGYDINILKADCIIEHETLLGSPWKAVIPKSVHLHESLPDSMRYWYWKKQKPESSDPIRERGCWPRSALQKYGYPLHPRQAFLTQFRW